MDGFGANLRLQDNNYIQDNIKISKCLKKGWSKVQEGAKQSQISLKEKMEHFAGSMS